MTVRTPQKPAAARTASPFSLYSIEKCEKEIIRRDPPSAVEARFSLSLLGFAILDQSLTNEISRSLTSLQLAGEHRNNLRSRR